MGLELLYRRRSHISMFFAGGICFLLLGEIEKRKLPVWGKGLLGAGAVTSVELLTGILWNRDHKVWDYRNLPGNFRGQICPLFSAVWIPLSLGGNAAVPHIGGVDELTVAKLQEIWYDNSKERRNCYGKCM